MTHTLTFERESAPVDRLDQFCFSRVTARRGIWTTFDGGTVVQQRRSMNSAQAVIAIRAADEISMWFFQEGAADQCFEFVGKTVPHIGEKIEFIRKGQESKESGTVTAVYHRFNVQDIGGGRSEQPSSRNCTHEADITFAANG